MEVPKKLQVPLEVALSTAGCGLYTNYVMLVSGLVVFSAQNCLQMVSVILPVAGCELGLTSAEKGFLASSAFGGLMLSSFLVGFLADIYGRRCTMLVCGTFNILLTLLASVAIDSVTLSIIWFVNGFLLGGVFTPAWVYVSEFCPQEIRARSILIPAGVSSLAFVYLPCMAWLILPLKLAVVLPLGIVFTSWRLYIALLAVPTFVTMVLLYHLPDSPKYVMNRGKYDKALEIIRTVYAVNNRARKADFPVEYLCLDQADIRTDEISVKGDANLCVTFTRTLTGQVAALFTPPLLLYSFLSIVLYFGVVGAYSTFYLWFPEQLRILTKEFESATDYKATICDVMSLQSDSGNQSEETCDVNHDIFIINAITALLQCTLFLVVSCIADSVGRKFLMVLFCVLSCVGCICLIYANTLLLAVSSLSVTVISLSIIFPVSYSIISGFFPTSLRSTAFSLTMLFGRFGAAAGSQIFGAMFEHYCIHAYWSIAGVLFSTVVISILMPTKRKL